MFAYVTAEGGIGTSTTVRGPTSEWNGCGDAVALVRTSVRMTSDGSSYSRFQRALKTQNLHLIRAAAAEVTKVELRDALAVCLVILERKPQDFERAVLRWIARFAIERPFATLETLMEAVEAFQEMRDGSEPGRAVATLRALC